MWATPGPDSLLQPKLHMGNNWGRTLQETKLVPASGLGLVSEVFGATTRTDRTLLQGVWAFAPGANSSAVKIGPQQQNILFAWLVENNGNPKKAKNAKGGANSGEERRPPPVQCVERGLISH